MLLKFFTHSPYKVLTHFSITQTYEQFHANNCDNWSLSDLILTVLDNHQLKDTLYHSMSTYWATPHTVDLSKYIGETTKITDFNDLLEWYCTIIYLVLLNK